MTTSDGADLPCQHDLSTVNNCVRIFGTLQVRTIGMTVSDYNAYQKRNLDANNGNANGPTIPVVTGIMNENAP